MGALIRPHIDAVQEIPSEQFVAELQQYKGKYRNRQPETIADAVIFLYVIEHTKPRNGFYKLNEDNSINTVIGAQAYNTRSKINDQVAVWFDSREKDLHLGFSYVQSEENQWHALWAPDTQGRWKIAAQVAGIEYIAEARDFLRSVDQELQSRYRRAQNLTVLAADIRAAMKASWPQQPERKKPTYEEIAPHHKDILAMVKRDTEARTQSPSLGESLSQMGALFAPLLKYTPLAVVSSLGSRDPSTPIQH